VSVAPGVVESDLGQAEDRIPVRVDWPGEVADFVEVRPGTHAALDGETEDVRAVGLLGGCVGVEVAPGGEAARRRATLVQNRREGSGLGERGVETGGVPGHVIDLVVGDRDLAGADTRHLVMEGLGRVVLVSRHRVGPGPGARRREETRSKQGGCTQRYGQSSHCSPFRVHRTPWPGEQCPPLHWASGW